MLGVLCEFNGLDKIDLSSETAIDIRNPKDAGQFCVKGIPINETITGFISPAVIHKRIKALGFQLMNKFFLPDLDTDPDNPPLIVSILDASFIFTADLLRVLEGTHHLPYELQFLKAKSYYGDEQGETIELQEPTFAIEDRNILVVDTIMDTGRTLDAVNDILRAKNPKSIRYIALLQKPDACISPIIPDYVGFLIPDIFIIGYGLDIDGKYRGLPYIGCLIEKDSSKLDGSITIER